jgi:hypothetical protein
MHVFVDRRGARICISALFDLVVRCGRSRCGSLLPSIRPDVQNARHPFHVVSWDVQCHLPSTSSERPLFGAKRTFIEKQTSEKCHKATSRAWPNMKEAAKALLRSFDGVRV